MKTYLLTHHWGLPVSILDALDKAGIDEWLQVWPGMIFFKGNKTQEFYASKIYEHSKLSMFILSEYDPHRSHGWMPPSVWEWLKPEPQHLPQTSNGLPHAAAEHLSHSQSAS
jgi:hypothetical protein